MRSAYQLEMERCGSMQGESSFLNKNRDLWNCMWKLRIPNAVRMFLWKACSNILPTKDNLKRRRVVLDDHCFICNIYVEFVWDCLVAQDVWGGSEQIFQKSQCDGGDFLAVMEYRMERCNIEELELAGVIACEIWKRRNSVLHGGNFVHPKRLIQEAEELLSQFRRANENNLSQVAETTRTLQVRWTNPPPNSYKANWDAAKNLKEKRIGIGVIIRDNMGPVFAAQCKTIHAVYDPTTAEAVAALHALELSRDSGLQEVLLEGDSKIVVTALKDIDSNFCRYGQVIDDAKVVLKAFRGWEVLHHAHEKLIWLRMDLQRRRPVTTWTRFG